MEIKTKYNIGDVIWVIDSITIDKCFVDCFVIGDIVCNIENDNNNNLIIYIAYSRKNSFHHIVEKDCFVTREEAQAECDRRNRCK